MATEKKSLIGTSKKAKHTGSSTKTVGSGKSISAKKMASPNLVGPGPSARLWGNHNQASLRLAANHNQNLL